MMSFDAIKKAAAAAALRPSIDAPRRSFKGEFDRRGGVLSTSDSRQSTRLSCFQPLLVLRDSFENASTLRALDPERGKRERESRPGKSRRLLEPHRPPRCCAFETTRSLRDAPRRYKKPKHLVRHARSGAQVPGRATVGAAKGVPVTSAAAQDRNAEGGEHACSLPLACSRAFSLSRKLLLIILTEGTRPLALLAHCV